jgi:hypothetical protein
MVAKNNAQCCHSIPSGSIKYIATSFRKYEFVLLTKKQPQNTH